MENLVTQMPKMLMGKELEGAMLSFPPYDLLICNADTATRIIALNDIMEIYVPSQMSYEIYSKIYLAMMHSLKKKQTVEAIKQGNQNHRRIQGLTYNSVLGGADSFSIIGPSGIGKSTALAKSIALSGGEQIITTNSPYAQIIPCVNAQCPHDCSVKGLLLEILSQVDMSIGTKYRQSATKYRASIDNIIGMVSQIALNNILLIVIDECQNICRNKGGVNLVASMTQLINSSGVSICMVGLPETESLFSQEMQLARRSVGLSYAALPCDDYFIRFCETLFSYQYVAHPSKLTPELIELLYECTGGIIAILVSIIIEAQQIAILSGKEDLSKETILLAYQERFKNVQDFVQVNVKKGNQTSAPVKSTTLNVGEEFIDIESDAAISNIIGEARNDGLDAVELLRNNGFFMEEIAV
ncbi:MAG: TniB family NTP-binding protein [Lachnospiraceae bacterium]|nr:TniB family NTP-binding protein [Lachnospiraceae bacterium]MDE7203159.1 TniB family NTP-binding protein [Lachnospiraceae bacterium]